MDLSLRPLWLVFACLKGEKDTPNSNHNSAAPQIRSYFVEFNMKMLSDNTYETYQALPFPKMLHSFLPH